MLHATYLTPEELIALNHETQQGALREAAELCAAAARDYATRAAGQASGELLPVDSAPTEDTAQKERMWRAESDQTRKPGSCP